MNKQLRFIILLFLLISAGLPTASGQATFASEEELKQQAFKLFEEDEFEEAYPLYSQLVSIYPKDANYNYRLGVCMLYASDDKEKAIPFLEFSAKKPDVEKEAIFYLAKAYHLNYRFDDAIGQYMAYAKVASESKANKLQVERQIEMCRSGKKLLRNITDLLVIDKKELSRADFYRAYDISDIGGKLLAKPDEESFRTPLDKKKKEKSIIYLATNNNQVYFSSYGDDLEHGKDIYLIRKLPNGEWSKPQTLGYPVNTEYDEDFPFLHPNGKVLYFCSKGHNSMGGYDIFKTTLNEETNTWNKPVNLDFPINTPDDDILYVTNEDEKEAFFSSARSSKTGKTAVFHINVERKPIDVAIIKGMVIKTKDEQALDVKITVKDLGDNTILGIYNAKESGSYLINLPNGGRFMYTVEAAGFNTQSEIVLLPTQYEFKPLKQEISYEAGTDKLIIKNLFDEPVDDQSYLLALNFIKSKSKLEAGVDAANAAAAKNSSNTASEDNTSGETSDTKNTSATTAKTTDTKTNSTSGSLSNDAIVKIAYDDAKEAEKEAKDLQEQADIALTLASQKNELAQNKAKEATQLMADAGSMTDNVKKQTVVEEANQASAESEELNQETVAAFNIAKKLQQKAAAKDEEAGLSLDYAKALEAAVKSKSPADALEKLKEQEQKLDALSEKNGTAEPDNIYAGLKMDADVKKRELDKVTQVSADIKQEIADNNTLMVTLQADADKTKKEDLKKGILEQIEGLKADTEESKKDLESNEQKLAKLSKEYNGIKNELELVSNVVDKAKVESNEAAAASVAGIDKTKLEAQVNEIKNTPIDDAVAINKANSNSSADNAAKNVITETNNSNSSDNAAKTNDLATNTSTDENKSAENKSTENNSVNTDSNKSTEIADNATSNSTTNKSTEEEASKNNSSVAKENYSNNFNNELAALSNNTATIENENKKVEIYNNWVAAITNDLKEKKALVKTEKDKTKKKVLSTEIAALENELKVKQAEEKAVVANVEKIKKENVVADNNTASENNTTSNSSNTDNTSNTVVSASQNLSAINQTYTDQIAVADKITKASEREDAKAVILKDWSAAINNNIEKQKQELSASTDPEMKALLEKKIRDAETLAKEKESLAVASINQAKKLKEQEGIIAANSAENKSTDASNDANKTTEETSANNSKSNETNIAANSGNENGNSGNNISNATDASTLTAEQKLNNSIAEAEKAGTESEREAKKAEAYRFYITAANDEIASKQNELKTEKNKDKKKELDIQILALQSEVKNTQVLMNESEQKLKALENVPVDANSTDVAVNSNKSTLEDTKVPDNSTSSEESNKTSEVKTENKIVYTNTIAAEKSKAAIASDKEAEQLITQATDLKAEAAEKNTQAEKNALYIKANELNAQAEIKKTEAAQLTSDANYSEFSANKDQLEQIAAATSGNNSDEVAIAEMMKDESATFFERAQKSRAIAGSVTTVTDKLAALEDAVANEKIALDKQRRATEIYKKANPSFVAVVNNNQTIIVKTNDQNKSETDKTNDVAVNQNKSADNSVTTDAAKTNDIAANANKSEQTDNNNTASEKSADNNAATKTDQSVDANKANTSDNKTTDVVTNEVKSSDNTNTNTIENSDQIKVSDTNKSEIAVNENKSNTENSTTTADQVKTTEATKISESTNNTESNNSNKSSDIAKSETVTNAALTNDAAKISENQNNNNINATSGTSLSKVVLAPTEKYERTTQPVYSASKPIPVNESLPDGLIYKVQIGAFRNPIAPEQFNGMSPLTAETTPQGFTRYTAGLFTKYSTADQVKNEIRQLGYKDAFVVIFLNGKRISIGEAMKLQSQDPTITVAATGIISDNSNLTNVNANTNAANSTSETKTTSTTINASTPAVSENVEVVSGLFYTVQVGVYSQAVSSSKLYNIQPLYTENTSNGNIRYNTGIFNNVQRAVEAKNIVIAVGVKDAFVTAYYKGKRISLAEAATLETQGSAIFSTDANINKLPTTGAGSVSPVKTNPALNQPEPSQVPAENRTTPVSTGTNQSVTQETSPVTSELKSSISQNTVSDSGVVFKVQIGAFKEEVPVSIANQFLQIAKKGIKNYKDQNGLTIYTLGGFKTYEEALQLKNEISSIVTDAFVVAYNNGNKISIDEAKTLQKK